VRTPWPYRAPGRGTFQRPPPPECLGPTAFTPAAPVRGRALVFPSRCRQSAQLRRRRGARLTARTSGGTIPPTMPDYKGAASRPGKPQRSARF